MSGIWHPTGRARVNARSPEAQACCDRCYLNFSLSDLNWQTQWAGDKLQNLRLRVCCECLDVPQIQLKSIIIPADPVPVLNPRPEAYSETVPSFVATESGTFQGDDLTTQDGDRIIWEDETTPLPDPNNPAIIPPQP